MWFYAWVVTFDVSLPTNSAVSSLHAASDLDLAKRCCAGEATAQRDLFKREKRRVHATLYRVLGNNTPEMDDLVQEAFLEIFRALHSFRGEAALGTWIDRVTVRVAYAHMRRPKSRIVALAVVPDAPSSDPSAEDRAMSRDALRRLYALLERLEARQRIAWVLHVLEGRPIAEVASVMEASVVATKVRLWRARIAIDGHARQDPALRDLVKTPATGEEE